MGIDVRGSNGVKVLKEAREFVNRWRCRVNFGREGINEAVKRVSWLTVMFPLCTLTYPSN
jgi:hypothetical protein